MNLLVGALTVGLILALLALGVFITFRIFNFPDITADGSITLGASITAILLYKGWADPALATIAGFGGGLVAGAVTGILHTKFRINGLLAGILVMTALYSINLRIMGRSNVPLLTQTSLATWSESVGVAVFGASDILLLGWPIAARDVTMLAMVAGIVVVVTALLYLFFRTSLGTAMRATGDNPQMTRAMGSDVEFNIIVGVALSNGLIALAGSILAQYQGFSDAQMGIGMIVLGLASVIIGEALVGTRSLGIALAGAVLGSVFFRLAVANALRSGSFEASDLKLVTAIAVFLGLVIPAYLVSLRGTRNRNQRHA
jgi:putative ABC transport system permease protein